MATEDIEKPRYQSFAVDGGDRIIYDVENEDAWIQSDTFVDFGEE